MYINLTTKQYPIIQAQIAAEFPNSSLPPVLSDAQARVLGYADVQLVQQPTYDPTAEKVVELPPAEINNVYVQQWTVVPLTSEELTLVLSEKIQAIDAMLTNHLDTVARTKKYDNRITCMVRAGFAGPFQAEGIAFATWCDSCNAMAYQLLQEIQAGTRALPGDPRELLLLLPEMVWPE